MAGARDGNEMIDSSINLDRILQGNEQVIWGARVRSEDLRAYRTKSTRGSWLFVSFLIASLVYAAYSNRGALFYGQPIGPASSEVIRITFSLFAVGIVWLIRYSLVSLARFQTEEHPAIYLITNRRLLASDLNYKLLDSMEVQNIESVFTIGSKSDELFVTRKNDPGSENNFYIAVVPNLSDIKSLIENLISKDNSK